MQYYVGVDIGGTNIRIGALDETMTLCRAVKKSSQEIAGETAPESLLNMLKEYIAGLDGKTAAVGIGFPATLNRERTKVLSAPNIVGFDNVEIKPGYEAALGLPVIIEKDSCMLLYNDIYKNKLPLDGVSIGCYFGTGLGNIVLVDGKPLIGKDGAAGELGHVAVLDKTDVCSCGLTGCLEMYAAGKALVRLCETHFPDILIRDIFAEKGNDPLLLDFVDKIAAAVAIEINILNPDRIVVGGGVPAMRSFPIETLRERIFARCRRPLPHDTLELVFSNEDTPFNGVFGAAVFAKHVAEAK